MRTASKILVGLAGLVAGGIGYAAWYIGKLSEQETLPPAPAPFSTKQEAPLGSNSISEEAQTQTRNNPLQPELTSEQLEEKYAAYEVQGFVHENRKPLQNVTIEAQLASILPTESIARWTTQTDNQGRFFLHVPANTLYDIEARFRTRSGYLRTNEVTVDAQLKGDNRIVEIEFADTPDVNIEVQGDTVQKAYLQKRAQRNLEALIQGTTAVFEDVEPRQLYTLFLVTQNRSLIQDEIPVFDKDITRVYTVADKKFGEITICDQATKQGIPHAGIEITLPTIDPTLYEEKVTTDQQGKWQGWFGHQRYNLRVNADGYIRKDLEAITLDAETTIALAKGGQIEGRVLDEKTQPVAGAIVYFLDQEDMSPRDDLQAQMTDQAGRFVMRGINPYRTPPFAEDAPETYFALAQKKGYAPAFLEPFTTATARTLELHLQKVNQTLEGRVVNKSGEGVPSLVTMQLQTLAGSTRNLANAPWKVEERRETDDAGQFFFHSLPPGTYLATLRPAPNTREYVATVRQVTLPTNTTTFALEQGISLEGRVFMETTDEAIPKAHIILTKKDDSFMPEIYLRTDVHGHFAGFVSSGDWHYAASTQNPARKQAIELQQGSFTIPENQNKIYLPIAFKQRDYVQIIARDAEKTTPLQSYQVFFREEIAPNKYATETYRGFDLDGIAYIPLRDPKNPVSILVEAHGYNPSDRIIVDPRKLAVIVDMKKRK